MTKPWRQSKDGSWRIFHGDCVKLPFADGSVDLVCCSPPYGAARTYGIDFKLQEQDWVDWAVLRYMECFRVCKGLVAWVADCETEDFRWLCTPFLLMADLHRAGISLRRPPIFHKSGSGIPGSGGADWLRNDYEPIICASHGRLPWSDNTAMGHPPKWAPGGEMSYRLSDGTRRNQWGGSAKSTGGERKRDGTLEDAKPRPSHRFHTKTTSRRRQGTDVREVQDYVPPVIANPGNVISGNVGKGHMGHALCHRNEAPFPEWLAEFFIRSFCPPGGTVLDPFSGSGTTMSVALAHGRKAIGVDIRESQCELTLRRIEETQLVLPVRKPEADTC